jgi:hypothetical protein
MLKKFIPFGISVLMTPFMGFIGLVSAGAGEGDFILAIFLFPFAILIGKLITPLMACSGHGDCFPRDQIFFLVALLQFPVYGLLFSIVNNRRVLAISIAAIHIVFFLVFGITQFFTER